ncbi:MAG: hypothetical protein QN160_09970 [Armatimonadota bacterium]|nr:hypothetical protein [Armatimonadota bacterium]MDR7574246.1 hypothetical protein [Armatimonadota bacterium]
MMRTWFLRGGHNLLGPGIAGVLLLLTASCGSGSADPYVPRPPAVSTAYQATVEQGAVELYLSGIKAEATLQRVRALETATAVAARATAIAQAQAVMATRSAWELQATRTAWEASTTATAQARVATATAETAAWIQAATATRAAWEIQATSTAVHASTLATAEAARAEQAHLEAERERLTYPLRAYGPWVMGFTIFALMAWAARRLTRAAENRIRAIPRDPRGDAPILVLPMRGGGEVVVDPDRSFGPALEIRGGVTQPQLAPPEYQAAVTARDQAVDLINRGLPGQAPRRRRLPGGLPGLVPPSPAIVRVVPPEQIHPWLEEVEAKMLEDQDLEGTKEGSNG